jgi:hypothetical protein
MIKITELLLFYMLFDSGEINDENSKSKIENSKEGSRVERILSFPLPGQCIFCGKQFNNNEERNIHKKEVHNV